MADLPRVRLIDCVEVEERSLGLQCREIFSKGKVSSKKWEEPC